MIRNLLVFSLTNRWTVIVMAVVLSGIGYWCFTLLKIEAFGDVVDRVTRMVKLRISVANPQNVLKAGMFATAQFGIKESRYIAVPRDAFMTVQGKNYVFVKTSENIFERREVATGDQINNTIAVTSGLKENERVAIVGVMQLKGLSFGY